MRRRRRFVVQVALALLCSGFVPDSSHATPKLFLVQNWDELSASDRNKAREKFEIYKKMPPARQREVENNYQRWKSMRPSDQERIRRNYDLYRDLTPKQRRAVGERHRKKNGAP